MIARDGAISKIVRRAVLPLALAAAVLFPTLASANDVDGAFVCRDIPYSPIGAPLFHICSDNTWTSTGGVVYVDAFAGPEVWAGANVHAYSAAGTPYQFEWYDRDATGSEKKFYGPWIITNTASRQFALPDATAGHNVYPVFANNGADQLGHEYVGGFYQ